MDHGVDCRERPVNGKVSIQIGGRPQSSLHHMAVKIRHHHVLCLHHGIIHTAGLDDHIFSVRSDGGNIAPGEDNKTVLHQFQICLQYFLFQFFQHTLFPRFSGYLIEKRYRISTAVSRRIPLTEPAWYDSIK